LEDAVLGGSIADQAALYALLGRFAGLGLGHVGIRRRAPDGCPARACDP